MLLDEMILTGHVNLSAGDLQAELAGARTLLDKTWLAREVKKEPSDPLLLHFKQDRSPQFLIHAIRHGVPPAMHPIAEAMLVGDALLDQYRKDGRLLGSTCMYLLKSLRTIADARAQIAGLEDRVRRLQGEDWKPILYEVLTAVAYVMHGTPTELIKEQATATPDIRLGTDPIVFVECKAKLQYEESVVKFISQWRKKALGEITDLLRQFDGGFIVRVSVYDDSRLRVVPNLVREMVLRGERERSGGGIGVNILPIDCSPATPPETMSAFAANFWRWAIGFDEWDDWHYVQPGGQFRFANVSNGIVEAVRKPVMICVRSVALEDNTQRVAAILKSACEKQFRSHRPGIIHMLVNTKLFGLRAKSTPAYVASALEQASQELFRQYSRVWKVVFDVVTPPPMGAYKVEHRRLTWTNGRCVDTIRGYHDPPAVVVV